MCGSRWDQQFDEVHGMLIKGSRSVVSARFPLPPKRIYPTQFLKIELSWDLACIISNFVLSSISASVSTACGNALEDSETLNFFSHGELRFHSSSSRRPSTIIRILLTTSIHLFACREASGKWIRLFESDVVCSLGYEFWSSFRCFLGNQTDLNLLNRESRVGTRVPVPRSGFGCFQFQLSAREL